jgi:hypothetical protein
MRKPYPTDLSDAECNYIEPHLPAPKGHGRPRIHDLREILNAIFYVLKSGCQWRLLPHDFPRWPTVYHYFRQWRIDGTRLVYTEQGAFFDGAGEPKGREAGIRELLEKLGEELRK